jgi:hypothetical protein
LDKAKELTEIIKHLKEWEINDKERMTLEMTPECRDTIVDILEKINKEL